MSSDLKKLYSDIIKKHQETPFHFERKTNMQNTIRVYNPICGDRFELYMDCDLQTIGQLYFHGYGCAISKASTSVLVETLDGRSLSEAMSLCDNFLNFINKDLKNNEVLLQEDFKAFSGVHDFPERNDCAALAWREMKKFLESKISRD